MRRNRVSFLNMHSKPKQFSIDYKLRMALIVTRVYLASGCTSGQYGDYLLMIGRITAVVRIRVGHRIVFQMVLDQPLYGAVTAQLA